MLVILYLLRQKFNKQTVHRKSLAIPKIDLREPPMDVWLRRKHFQAPTPPKKMSPRKQRLMQLRKLYGISKESENESEEETFEDLYQWSLQI
jgi:hypothetical protein